MGDSYRPPPDRDRDRGRDNAGFSFRGAAGDSYRPPVQQRPEERFTFAPPPMGPSAPRFPAQQPPPRGPQSNPSGTNKTRGRGRGRGRGRPPGAGRQFHRMPRPAHARAILNHQERETTPEQLNGMSTDGHMRFADNDSDSENGEDDVSSDSDDSSLEDDNENDGSRKRVKMDDAEPARPKWSNPDPYSVLPPTDLGLQPKKDIVQSIRKAKIDTANEKGGTNAVKENADFISFDFDDEKDSDDDMDEDGKEDRQSRPQAASPSNLWTPSDMELAEMYVGSDVGGRKRKRGLEQSSHAGIIVTEWQTNYYPNPTPWYKNDPHFMSSTGLQLHMEIQDFFNYVKPLSYEADVRDRIMGRVESVVRQFRAGYQDDVKIRSFGSFACNLYLPTADMDLVAVSRAYEGGGSKRFCTTKSQIYALSRHIAGSGIAKSDSMQTVPMAKVPIIKFVDQLTGIKVDISFENDSGLFAINTFRNWKEDYPEMPPLVMIIKQFLAMRGLNEVYLGGIGGFTIICLVVSMLQLMPENQRKSSDTQPRLGWLLLHFLDLYGNKFNLEEVGIKMMPPGYFNKKDPRACSAKINATRLTIIDPNNETNDISGGSKEVEQVFRCFRGALAAIQQQLSKVDRGEKASILGCILGGNYSSFEEQRVLLNRINQSNRSYQPPPPAPQSNRSYQPPPPAPAPAPAPASYPWHRSYSQQVPPPARGGRYYAAHNSHAFQQPGAPAASLPTHQGYQFTPVNPSLPARPPTTAGYGPGPQSMNSGQNTKSKKRNKKAKQGQNAPHNTNADATTKSKAQKKKEKKERKERRKLQQQTQEPKNANGAQAQNLKGKKSKEDTEQEKREKAKKGRDQRAKKRLDTLYGDVS